MFDFLTDLDSKAYFIYSPKDELQLHGIIKVYQNDFCFCTHNTSSLIPLDSTKHAL